MKPINPSALLACGLIASALAVIPAAAAGQEWTCTDLPRPASVPWAVSESAVWGAVAARIKDGTAAYYFPVALPGRVVSHSRLDSLWATDPRGVATALAAIATGAPSFTHEEAEIAGDLFRIHGGPPAVMLSRLGVADDVGRLRALRALRGLPRTADEEQVIFLLACKALRILVALGPEVIMAREDATGIGVLEELLVESWHLLGRAPRGALAPRVVLLPSPVRGRLTSEAVDPR